MASFHDIDYLFLTVYTQSQVPNPYLHPYLLTILRMSLPKTKTISASRIKNPAICAFSRNLSLNGFPWIISMSKKTTCPPSNAGIGKKFISANAIDKSPTNVQNFTQSTSEPNIVAIRTGPDMALSARNSPVAILPRPLALSINVPQALEAPIGNDSKKPYEVITYGKSVFIKNPNLPSSGTVA